MVDRRWPRQGHSLGHKACSLPTASRWQKLTKDPRAPTWAADGSEVARQRTGCNPRGFPMSQRTRERKPLPLPGPRGVRDGAEPQARKERHLLHTTSVTPFTRQHAGLRQPRTLSFVTTRVHLKETMNQASVEASLQEGPR